MTATTPGGWLLVLALVLPVGGMLAAFVLGGRSAERIALAVLGLGILLAGLIAAGVYDAGAPLAYLVGGWVPPLGLVLQADGVAAAMLLTSALVLGAVALYGRAAHATPPGAAEARAPFAFWCFLLALSASLAAAFLGGDLFNLFVALEMLTFAALALACLEGRPSQFRSELRYLLFALIGSVLYLLGTALLYGGYGALDIRLLAGQARADTPTMAAAALMTAGLVAKMALFPLHLWLPAAHAGAPPAASAVLSGLVVKASFVLLLRLWFWVMPPVLAAAAAPLLALLGAAAILVGSLVALRQVRLKLLVAYSTVAQIGYLFLMFPIVLAGDAEASARAWLGGVLQAASHAFAKAAMFLSAGLIAGALGHDRVAALGGAGRAMPMAVIAFGLAGLSLMGIPPSGGFTAKWMLLTAAIAAGQWWWALVILGGGVLTGGYVYRVISGSLTAPPAAAPVPAPEPSLRVPQRVALALALVSVGLGLLPLASFGLVQIGRLGAAVGNCAVTGAQLLLVTTIAVPLGMLAACLWKGPRRRMHGLLWLAPLPGLAAALGAADAPPLVMDPQGLRLTLALDAPSALLLGTVALLWSAAGAYAHGYLGREAGAGRFALWWLITLSGSLGVFVAADLVSFYLAFAAVSLAAFGLIVQDGTARARRAGEITLLLAVAGEVCLLLAFALLADMVEGPSLALADALAALPRSPARGFAVGLLIAGFGLKAGLVPLHVWLPLAHPAAPMPASAVLSGAIVKAGVIGLIRFLPADGSLADWGGVLAGLGLLTAFWGVGCGIAQANPKTVLAYSTVSQMGVTAAALGMGVALAEPATPMPVAFYAAHHVLAKGALFLAVGLAAATGGPRRLWLVLAPAVVLALGFGGLPGTGGALAKAAVKPQLGAGLVGLLSALSAAGSTLLMLHFVRRLAALAPAEPATRPDPVLLLPWLGLAAASVLVPWALYGPAGLGDPWGELGKDVLAFLWPVLLGAVLALALARWGDRLGRVPEGDVLLLTGQAVGVGASCGAVVGRAEAALRAWPAAGLALLALVLVLLGAMLTAVP